MPVTRWGSPTWISSPHRWDRKNLCIAHILKNGGGRAGLRNLFDELLGPSESNDMMAELLVEQAKDFPFMNQ